MTGVAEVRVDGAVLREHASRIDEIREAIAPRSLPPGFAPAGADAASAAHATSISGRAAAAMTGLWGAWASLGQVSQTLRVNAAGYDRQESAGMSSLSGGSGGAGPAGVPVVTPPVAPVVTGLVYAGAPTTTPEALAAALRAGAGEQSPRDFAGRWRDHADRVQQSAGDLAAVRAGLSGSWSGDTADGADDAIKVAHADLSTHHDAVNGVASDADSHALTYRMADMTIPTPQDFGQWHANLANATAANAAYPGVYGPAVAAAQQDLSTGYATAGQGYGQYATDPATGDLVDTTTGQHFDPVTGQPVTDDDDGDSGDGEGSGLQQMGPEVLTGLLGGVLGGVGAGVGALVQGGQQLAQVATKSLGALAKSAGSTPADSGLSDPSLPDLSAGGGGGDMSGGGGGGGDTEPAAAFPPGVGTASPPPSPTAAEPTVGPGAAGAGGPGSGMGAPMMPMGGGGAGGGGAPAGASGAKPHGKKLVGAQRANTQRVLGQVDAERISDKRARRESRMRDVKREALEASTTEEADQ